MLGRTYRTDPYLRHLPVPKVSIITGAGAALCAFSLIWWAPLPGWSPIAAMVLAPMFAIGLLTDAAGRVLPDILSGALVIAGIALAVTGQSMSVIEAGIGLVGMAVGLWLVRSILMRAYGDQAFCLGDYKFVTASAAAVSFEHISWAMALAGPLAAFVVLWRRMVGNADETLPYGSLYAAGLALAAFAEPAFTAAYPW